MNLLFLAAAASVVDPETVVVTASRTPVVAELSGGAISVIDRETVEALNLPLAGDLLRLTPGLAVAQSGPLGSQTQVRIRGAEANHSLVFVDGIESNDPASSSEFRFETLSTEGIERIEVLRGPQSALWGSEAIGGVVSVTTLLPPVGRTLFASAEGGSFGTVRAAGGIGAGSERGGVIAQAGYIRSTGIDAFAGGPKERDGYENLTLNLKGLFTPSPDGEIGIVARYTDSDAEFDGSDPLTFAHADTLDETRIRNLTLGAWGEARLLDGRWVQRLSGSYLDSSNRNRDGRNPVNRSDGHRFKAGYQSALTLSGGGLEHRIVGAAEYEFQQFIADDVAYGGFSKQRRSREQKSLVGEYRLTAFDRASLSASIRRDDNDRFQDATTWRFAAAALLPLGFDLHASYGKGVNDPTFTEQFGFFPGSFVGNPDLQPETARGFDVGLGWRTAALKLDLTYFRTNLRNEIVPTFTFAGSSVTNASGKSKREGLEASLSAQPIDWLALEASYTYLNATDQQVARDPRLREVRRPKHSGSLTAMAKLDPIELAAALAYSGKRQDTDFDSFPARSVTLDDYVLATVSGSYRLSDAVELTARVENAFDADYQDVYGYETSGIAAYGGIRVRWGG